MGQSNSTPSPRSSRRSASSSPPQHHQSLPQPTPPPLVAPPHSSLSSSSPPVRHLQHQQLQQPAMTPPPPPPPPQPRSHPRPGPSPSATPPLPPSSSSRVLRSTTERRRRANLFSSFYPLLSRNNNNNTSSSSSSSTSTPVTSGASSPECGPSSRSNSSHTITQHGNHPRPDLPPRSTTPGVNTRSSARSPGLAPSLSGSGPSSGPSTRTPRGLSRVQRMYDQESIRSNASSSRPSSLLAVGPPSPSTFPASIQDPTSAPMPMEVDPESVGLVPQPMHPQHQHQHSQEHRPQMELQSPSTRRSTRATRDTPDEPMTLSTASSSGASFTTTTSSSLQYDNPRGGTSISSSLLPIRPDSDDENEDEGESMDQSGPAQRRSRRVGRYPGPDLVADLIHQQFAQALSASAGPETASSTAQSSTLDPLLPTVDDADDQVEPLEAAGGPQSTSNGRNSGPTSVHRRRLRSSSLRGMLGFQPLDNVALDEGEGASTPSEESAMDTETDAPSSENATRPTSSQERSQFILNQLPFLTRLLADIGRGFRTPTPGPSGEDSPALGSDAAVSENTAPTHPTPGHDHSTGTGETPASAEPATGPSERTRRHHATIRLIHVGGSGFGLAGNRPTEGATSTEAGDNTTETPRREGADESLGNAFIMFLSSPGSDSQWDLDSTETPATEGTSEESGAGHTRPRPRAPWVVFTLTGAYLNSLMAAGAEAEGGMSYDHLWMLSNLIGPARPITTTQEAIDGAGFHVGPFEQEVQGMRGCSTLGDGSKCLVCMSEYEEGEDMRALKCKHGFHQECIDKWLTTGANKCPVCRAVAVAVAEPDAPTLNALAAEE